MACTDRALLVRYCDADGAACKLTPAQRQEVQLHLSQCGRCASLAGVLTPAAGPLLGALAESARRSEECPSPENLREYVHRRLPGRIRSEVRSHLRGCEACLRRIHFLQPARQQPDAGRVGGLRSTMRPVWLPLAVALPGYVLAIMALTGHLSPVPPTSPTAPSIARVASPASRQHPAPTDPPRITSARVQPQVTPRRPAPNPPRQSRPAGVTPSIERDEGQIATPTGPNHLMVQAIDTTLGNGGDRITDAGRHSLNKARQLIVNDRVDDAAGVLLAHMSSEEGAKEGSISFASCLALLQLASPGGDRRALDSLSTVVSREFGTDPRDRPIEIVHLAAGLAQAQGANRTLRDAEAYQHESDEESLPVEALILAGIILDRPTYQPKCRAALRQAIRWLERDLKDSLPEPAPGAAF